MNKKLLALAVAAAMTAPMAANADVTIYGKMHVSIDATDSSDSSDSDNTSISSNSSRIGFKGSEDLGNGLKAVWQVENDTVLDEADGAKWASRQSFLGLAGDFGTVAMGKLETPFKLMNVNPFGDTIGDNRALLGTNNDTSHTFNMRTKNTIAYISPNMGGVSVIGAYVTDHTNDTSAEDDNNTDAFSASVKYKSGGLMLGGAFERHNFSTSGTVDGLRLAASMTMGATMAGFVWENTDGQTDHDRDAWTVALTQGFGNNKIKAAYTTVNESSNNLDEASMWAIGLDHVMSKRTTVYGMYSSLTNDDNSARQLGVAGHGDKLTSVSGGDQSGFSMGLVHTF
ncbi:hypothetical protein BOW53_11375 [Solemya pervernicosa gill symbiont]|uniref:Porin domain-containing protein n=2 Tax=Gammaproteobacteria incertae sedis TaxID=118884 RepID=A0A1T2L351_9GAMM|nr:porin [Candidatus Reidiella endopervernicosa]OOZ39504.1 hypothetical protein BOW53_11375 [Solemya pervernicosa gill symbiont]QKQ25870.1 porin [Candidatus Reidiella endopervernicosa]